jgi:uncharacterized SAM-dependent methyltransferase
MSMPLKLPLHKHDHPFEVLDCHPVASDMLSEVMQSLQRTPKHLPSKYFYDGRGAELFEEICDLPEYYPTRTEISILEEYLPRIAQDLGPQRWLVEPGSGSGLKTDLLLEGLQDPAAYVPIDISKRQLALYATRLQKDHPNLQVRPVCADFTQDLQFPTGLSRPVIWFPGSTIGNFSAEYAARFLRRLRGWSHGQAELLIGVDLRKNIDLNRALGSDFDGRNYRHEACWNEDISAMQMFLISQGEQVVQIGGAAHIQLRDKEAICTEYSHKYSLERFQNMAGNAGWKTHRIYTDAQEWFAIFHFR